MKDVGLEDEIGKAYQIIGVKEIDANLKEFAFFRQNLDIGEIQLHNPSVVVIRDSDSLNLVQLLTHIVKEQKAQVKQDAKEAKEKSALPADEKKTPNDWSWNIDKVSVRNGTINFTDTTNNFKRSATNVNVTLAPITGEDGRGLPLMLPSALSAATSRQTRHGHHTVQHGSEPAEQRIIHCRSDAVYFSVFRRPCHARYVQQQG